MNQTDKIIETGEDILVVNNNPKENYKCVIELLSKLDTTKYDPTITLITDNIHAELFKNLDFSVEMTPCDQHKINDKSLSGKKKIIVNDFNYHCKNDPYALRYFEFDENVYKIVLFSPLAPGHSSIAEHLHELMKNNTLYINNNVVYCKNPKYIPDPRFVKKKSSWL